MFQRLKIRVLYRTVSAKLSFYLKISYIYKKIKYNKKTYVYTEVKKRQSVDVKMIQIFFQNLQANRACINLSFLMLA